MTSLLQMLCRKMCEVRIRQKACEIRNRARDRNLMERRAPRSTAGIFGSQHQRRRADASRE
jgi:hypothetical protein